MNLHYFWPTFSLIGLIFYAMRSVGLYSAAKNTGMQYPWWAFVPLLHEYLTGKMADRARGVQDKKPFIAGSLVILFLISFGMSIFMPIFKQIILIGLLFRLIFWLVNLIILVMFLLSEYWLYVDFEPNHSILYTILAAISLGAIPKFLIRNNVPVGVAGYHSGGQPKYS